MDDQDFNSIVSGIDAPSPTVEATTSAEANDIPGTTDDAIDEVPSREEEAAAEAQPQHQPQGGPVNASPPVDQWADPNNPYYQQAVAMQRQREYEAQQWAAWQAQQQQQAMLEEQERIDQYIREVASGDVEVYQGLRSAIDAHVAPLQYQASQLYADMDRANKVATALNIAATAILPPEQQGYFRSEVERLMSLGDPSMMAQDIEFRRQLVGQYQQQMEATRKELDDLRRQVAAKAQVADRASRGADAVASGSTANGVRSIDQYDDFDSWFNDFVGGRAL